MRKTAPSGQRGYIWVIKRRKSLIRRLLCLYSAARWRGDFGANMRRETQGDYPMYRINPRRTVAALGMSVAIAMVATAQIGAAQTPRSLPARPIQSIAATMECPRIASPPAQRPT